MFCKKIEEKVLAFIKANRLLVPGDTILIGVSGGGDSIFLLNLLSHYSEKLSIEIACCHIDHGLRGRASEADELFVRQWASDRKIRYVLRSIDVASFSKEHAISLEDAGRRLRLDALISAAKEFGAQKIALAHTADDCVETVLLNLLRGTGRKGLSGIQAKRDDFIRPLLCLRRKEIIGYLKEKHIDFCVDVSNWHTDFTRNFVRHELIPFIEKKLRRNISTNILQLAHIMTGEERMLTELTDNLFACMCQPEREGITLKRKDLRELMPAMQSRIILRCYSVIAQREEGLNFREVGSIRQAIAGTSSGIRFPIHDVEFLIGTDTILVARKKPVSEINESAVNLDTSDEVDFLGRYRIKTSIIDSVNGDMSNPDCAYFNLEKLALPLTLRKRRNGDAFMPFGMDQEKKVKELLIDEKVPFWKRDTIPIISDAKGIVWVAGVRRASVAKVEADTKKILKMEKIDLD